MTSTRTLSLKIATAAAVCALSFTAGVPAALADTQVVTGNFDASNSSPLDPATIDASKHVDLTLIRREVTDADGQKQSVSGVEFVVKKLDGYEINSREGWDKALAVTVDEAKKLPGTTYTGVTDASGKAHFDIPVGLYFVTEKAPVGASPKYRQAVPFLITLPIVDEKTKAWSYRGEVTPKTFPNPVTEPNPPANNPSGSSVLIPFLPFVFIPPVTVSQPPAPGQPPAPVSSPEPSPVPSPVPDVAQPPVPEKGIPKLRLPLPNTGADVIGLLLGGFGLAVAGGVLMVVRRRRS